MTRKAIEEVLGLEVRPAEANKMFRNVYIHLLRNDVRGLLQTLSYRDTLADTGIPMAQYKVFKFTLELLLRHNPGQLEALCPLHQHHAGNGTCPLGHARSNGYQAGV